jgi:multidrug efflux pump subunit AcrA (membrane-fusion protein)
MDRIEELLVFVTVADMRGFAQAGRRLSIELKDGKNQTLRLLPRGVGHFCSGRGLEQPRRRFESLDSAQLGRFKAMIAKRGGAIRRAASLLQTVSATRVSLLLQAALLAAVILVVPCAMAQPAPSAPPAVGVITVERRPMTDSYEFNGRIEAINSVNIVARVTAFLEQQLFTEGADVKKGDLLYTLERPPFQAAVDLQKAAVAQADAQLENAKINLWRAQQLVRSTAGTQKAVDDAQAAQRSGPITSGTSPA